MAIHSSLIKAGKAWPVWGVLVLALFLVPASAPAVTYNIYADVTTITMPDTGEVVTMWGFGLEGGPVTVPGPLLTVPDGDTQLVINLRNNLTPARTGIPTGCPVSLVIAGQNMPQGHTTPAYFGAMPYPQFTGRIMSLTYVTMPGGNGTYTWNNLRPGTYLYHSGNHLPCHIQMGLFGVMKRDFASGQAYGGINFNQERLLVFSEIDPAFHQAVAMLNYGPGKSMTSTVDYHPKYFLINGVPFSTAGPPPPINIPTTGTTLLRIVNAGLQTHVPLLQGLYYNLVAENGSPYPYPKQQYAPVLPAGSTLDALITDPPVGQYPLYDRRLNLTNNTTAPGGMLTYLNAGFIISGTLRTSFGTPIAGATVTLSGQESRVTYSDAAGNYQFGGLDTGSYIVTPTKPGIAFYPSSRFVFVNNADRNGISFEVFTYSVTGRVTAAGGAGLGGVTLNLNGFANKTAPTTATGTYRLNDLYPGAYTLTPVRTGFGFSPLSRSFTITNASLINQNFSGTALAATAAEAAGQKPTAASAPKKQRTPLLRKSPNSSLRFKNTAPSGTTGEGIRSAVR